MAGDSHPLHPATVHFPIAFLLASYALDVSHQLPFLTSLPVLGPFLHDIDIPKTSYYLLSLALLSAIPAILTGGMELVAMIARQDLLNKLSKSPDKLGVLKSMHPKLKTAFLHAVINDVVMMGSGYSWFVRSRVRGYHVDVGLTLLSVVFALVLMGTAGLGGQLVFDYGVGVVAMGKRNRDDKEK